eukprot:6478740-Amphidinium_carterae.1
MPALEAHMARLQFAKGVWFPERLAKHAGTEPWCLLCGQRGTLQHRVFTCPAFARHRAHFLRRDDLEFYASLSEADAAVWASLHMPAPRPAPNAVISPGAWVSCNPLSPISSLMAPAVTSA